MLSWNLLFYIKCRSAVTGSPQITKTALSWVGLGFVAKIPWGEMGVEGAYHSQAEKYIGRGRFAKSAGRAESKILIAHKSSQTHPFCWNGNASGIRKPFDFAGRFPPGAWLSMGGVARFALLIGLVGQLLDPFDFPKESNKQRQLF